MLRMAPETDLEMAAGRPFILQSLPGDGVHIRSFNCPQTMLKRRRKGPNHVNWNGVADLAGNLT